MRQSYDAGADHYAAVNSHLAKVFGSIFNSQSYKSPNPYSIIDICQNICPCPGLNQCILS